MAPASSQDELGRLKEIFLSSLNHEIRTPLAGILGMADLLLETRLDEEQREYVSAARLCAENLFEILNEALEYSSLEAGMFVLEETEFDIREALEAAVAQHRPKALSKKLALTLSVDANLPVTMLGDAPRIRELLGHLIGNAIKFTHSGSVDVTASVEASSGGDRLVMEVRDTGIGIPPERIATVFESFRQGEQGLTRKYPGLGLGLALARKLATVMGGEISVESTAGQGSIFRVRLPGRPAADTDVQRKRRATGELAEVPVILAVDDNPIGLTVIRGMLGRRSVKVETASSGREALDAAARRRYDLVLMDLQMPDIDGLTAAAELRKLPGYANVPILALTANFSDETRETCRAYGMQAYIAKPVDAEELWSTISHYLGK